jgi:hypothetical protein
MHSKDLNCGCLLQVSIPCKKKCYRLYGKEGYPLVDIMTGEDEPGPKVTFMLKQSVWMIEYFDRDVYA